MITGRDNEIKELRRYAEQEEAQFIAVYGRRRVGKTYLIRETFDNNFSFYHTGISESPLTEQLEQFRASLIKYGLKKCNRLKNWFDAFEQLTNLVSQKGEQHKVIFIDELPWLDTPKSRFIPALEHFWNGWASAQKNLTLIVCGSATSWIINNIIRNHGGLYNRLTGSIHLQPFNLNECEEFCKAKHMALSRKNIAEAYMIFGGIPYYWNFIQNNLSLSQNIDKMFFAQNAPLKDEFRALYQSLFKKPEPYLKIVTVLSNTKSGMDRSELLEKSNLSNNSTFSTVLTDLEQCGFIRKFRSFGKKNRNALFQLIDNFTLFHFQFVKNSLGDENFWTDLNRSPQKNTWFGLAFERLCLWHIPQIKKALGITGIATNISSWHTPKNEEHPGAQIDLLIDRKDDTINLCEMKFSDGLYHLDKTESEKLGRRIQVFKQVTKTTKAIHTTLVTTVGLDHNEYWNDIQSTISLEDLFVAD